MNIQIWHHIALVYNSDKFNSGAAKNSCKRVVLLIFHVLLSTGWITADELKFVLTHLPGKVTYKEIDEMIKTVDENGDGKINYQEFRVMIGAKPNLTANMPKTKETKPTTGGTAASGAAASATTATKT